MAAPISLLRRDVAILLMVQDFGGCTAVQVAKRLFPEMRTPRVCYRHIAGLVDQGYLTSHRLPALSGVGSGKAFLALTPKGRSIAAVAQGVGTKELHRNRPRAPRFIEHHLAIGDTRIAFESAAVRSSIIKLSDWAVDRRTVLDTTDGDGQTIELVPDGAFTLRAENAPSVQALLEQDTGTLTHRGRMRTRLLGYLRYTQQAPALVLFVTTTKERVSALAQLALDAGSAAALDPRAIWFATTPAVTSENPLFGRIWRLPGNETLAALPDVFGPLQPMTTASGGPIA